MAHSSHAHPLPDGQTRYPGLAADAAASQNATQDSKKTLQHRNPRIKTLNIRHSRFAAPSLAARRVSPLFAIYSRSNEVGESPLGRSPVFARDAEESGRRSASPVNVLREIHNSSQRQRKTPGQRLDAGLTSRDGQVGQKRSPATPENPWYYIDNTDNSPSVMRTGPAEALQESVLNSVLASDIPASPLSRKSRVTAVSLPRPDSIHAPRDEFIDHLESKLASTTARLESVTSSDASKARAARLRALTTENRNLKAENMGWAKKAEDMVEQERWMHRTAEAGFDNKVEDLNEEMSVKEARIAELEWELESLSSKVKDADGLLEANAKLEKRIDVLSEMIVGSPSRNRTRSTSPQKTESFKRTPRPLSMLPRMPLSPTRSRTGFLPELEPFDSRASSSSTVLKTPEDLWRRIREESPGSSQGLEDDHSLSTGLQPSKSMEMSLHDSDSYCSAPPIPSLTSSAISERSRPAYDDVVDTKKQRRMRRFPSGSLSLKPLILPTATSVPPLPPSPYLPSLGSAISSRDASGASAESNRAAYITDLVDDQPEDTPTLFSRHRSRYSTQEETLAALEGRHKRDTSGLSGTEVSTSPCRPTFTQDHKRDTLRSLRTKRLTLEEDLNSCSISPEDTDDTKATRGLSMASNFVDDFDVGGPDEAIPSQSKRTTLMASEKVEESHIAKTESHAVAEEEPQHMDRRVDRKRGMVMRLSGLIMQNRQSPLALARRIVADAWSLGTASMGGIVWWLIGHQLGSWTQLTCENCQKPLTKGRSGPFPIATHTHSTRSSNSLLHSSAGPPTDKAQLNSPPCKDCIEPNSRRTLRIWFHFCLTVVLAVGMAVKHGPDVLIAESIPSDEAETITTAVETHEIPTAISENSTKHQSLLATAIDSGEETIRFRSPPRKRMPSHASSNSTRNGTDSGYDSISTTEPLGRVGSEES